MAKTENAIWVIAQLENGETLGVTYELLGQARRLADTAGQNTAVVLIGKENKGSDINQINLPDPVNTEMEVLRRRLELMEEKVEKLTKELEEREEEEK